MFCFNIRYNFVREIRPFFPKSHVIATFSSRGINPRLTGIWTWPVNSVCERTACRRLTRTVRVLCTCVWSRPDEMGKTCRKQREPATDDVQIKLLLLLLFTLNYRMSATGPIRRGSESATKVQYSVCVRYARAVSYLNSFLGVSTLWSFGRRTNDTRVSIPAYTTVRLRLSVAWLGRRLQPPSFRQQPKSRFVRFFKAP